MGLPGPRVGWLLRFCIVWLVVAIGPAMAESRIALVVANGEYDNAPLSNPLVDASLVRESLTDLGFDVTVVENASLAEFDAAISNFSAAAEGADVALFYYAGHGFAVTDAGVARNYLMSTDADVTSNSERLLRSLGIALDDIISEISSKAETTLVFIDACRNDPRVTRSGGGRGRGAVPITRDFSDSIFVGLSTRAGDVAEDGAPGAGSPFARAFAANIGLPDQRIVDVFTRIRLHVEEGTNRRQRPDVGRYDLLTPVVLRRAPSPAATLAPAPPTIREDVKVGLLLDFSGPISSLTPPMAQGAELALREVNDSGKFLSGEKLIAVRADSTCVDPAAAAAAARSLVIGDGVIAIVGAACSGATIAAAREAAIPNGVVMVSPSASSPALSALADDGLVFRTAPSDGRLGEIIAAGLISDGKRNVAVTYVDSDYGKGLTDSFAAAFQAAGGSISAKVPHADAAIDYSGEADQLAAAGGETLVVFGYADGGGSDVVRAALKSGAFKDFAFGDGMYSDSLLKTLGSQIDGSVGYLPWPVSEGADLFEEIAGRNDIDRSSAFARESYDAAALIALAIQKSGSTDRRQIRDHVLDVANAPGEKILPGQLAKALEILRNGGDVDYVGASNVELVGSGDAVGSFGEYEIRNGKFRTVRIR